MSTLLLWCSIGTILALELAAVALCWAPKKVWRWLDERNPHATAWLWGYSHLFGPRLSAGNQKPWLR
jgi:hypothetical protein